jgi:hypothetical protein
MATLPDLPTSNISLVAFWNAANNGHDLSALDETELLSAANWVDYTVYDNGVQGTFELYPVAPQRVTVRYKSDGWVIAWVERTLTTGEFSHPAYTDTPDAVTATGLVNVFPAWTWDGEPMVNLPESALTQVIGEVWGQFSNHVAAEVAPADVAYHTPVHGAATNLSMQMARWYESRNAMPGLSYTAATTRYEHISAFLLWMSGVVDNADPGVTEFPAGTPHLSHTYSGEREVRAAVVDTLAENLMPDPGTVYSLDVSGPVDADIKGGMYHLMMWG